MKYRMSEGMTNIGTPLKEAMERTPRPNTPLGLPLLWDAPAPRTDGSLINEGTKNIEQEPVEMYRSKCADGSRCLHGCHTNEPLYTTPPQRTWVGLDNDDLVWIYSNSDKVGQAISNTEAKLKEKNTQQDTDCKYCTNGCAACDARKVTNVLP